MSASKNSALCIALGLWVTGSALISASGNLPAAIQIAAAEAKSARILDASVVEVSHSVKARISFYEVTRSFMEVNKETAIALRQKIVEGKYAESDPMIGRPSGWFIVNGLSDKGSVMLALGDRDIIYFRGCSPFTTTAYQNDDRAFGDGSVQDAALWKALSVLKMPAQGTK